MGPPFGGGLSPCVRGPLLLAESVWLGKGRLLGAGVYLRPPWSLESCCGLPVRLKERGQLHSNRAQVCPFSLLSGACGWWGSHLLVEKPALVENTAASCQGPCCLLSCLTSEPPPRPHLGPFWKVSDGSGKGRQAVTHVQGAGLGSWRALTGTPQSSPSHSGPAERGLPPSGQKMTRPVP